MSFHGIWRYCLSVARMESYQFSERRYQSLVPHWAKSEAASYEDCQIVVTCDLCYGKLNYRCKIYYYYKSSRILLKWTSRAKEFTFTFTVSLLPRFIKKCFTRFRLQMNVILFHGLCSIKYVRRFCAYLHINYRLTFFNGDAVNFSKGILWRLAA
jgi:hypothetical protein